MAINLRNCVDLSKSGTAALFVLCVVFCYRAFGAVPATVIDAQVIPITTLSQPEGLTASANGAIYVADSGNGRVLSVSNGTSSVVSTPGFTLGYPDAVAVDAVGNLYIADGDTADVIEVPVSGSPILLAGPPTLSYPSALAVDSNGNVYVGDAETAAIYEVSGGAISTVSITGITSIVPNALLVDASNNLYIADAISSNIYKVPSGGGAPQIMNPSGFTLNQPAGLTFDAQGNLYILDAYNERVIEEQVGNPSISFEVPITGFNSPTSIAVGQGDGLYITDYYSADLTQVVFSGTDVAALGQAELGHLGNPVQFNLEFNTPETLTGFQVVSVGDVTQEVSVPDGNNNCAFQSYYNANNGDPVAPANPFICGGTIFAAPAYPGIRNAVVQVQGQSGELLASLPTVQTGLSAEPFVYPLTGGIVVSGLYSPGGIAFSGANETAYFADSGTDTPGTANVYSWNGVSGTTPSVVDTSPFVLSYPSGVALNDVGDLYISDYELGEVIVVPADKTIPPYKLNTGSLLHTPWALGFDLDGNLIIADDGPDGEEATTAQPGYLVEVPHDGRGAFIMNTSPVAVVDPGGIAFAPNGDLYVADTGAYDPATGFSPGDVVLVPHDGSAASVVVPPLGLPSSVEVDAAGDLNVLYAYPGSITVIPAGGGSAYSLPFSAPEQLEDAEMLTPVQGGQSLVLADATNGDFLYLSGFEANLAFPTTVTGSESSPMTGAVLNIGNLPLKLGQPYSTASGQAADFPIQTTTTCANSLVIDPAASCGIDAVFAPTASGSFAAALTLSATGFSLTTPSIGLTGTEGSGMDVVSRPASNPSGQPGPQSGLKNRAGVHCRRRPR